MNDDDDDLDGVGGVYRCVRCRRDDVPWSEGCYDELECEFHDPVADDDNGLCDDCWVLVMRYRRVVLWLFIVAALLSLVAAVAAWLLRSKA